MKFNEVGVLVWNSEFFMLAGSQSCDNEVKRRISCESQEIAIKHEEEQVEDNSLGF